MILTALRYSLSDTSVFSTARLIEGQNPLWELFKKAILTREEWLLGSAISQPGGGVKKQSKEEECSRAHLESGFCVGLKFKFSLTLGKAAPERMHPMKQHLINDFQVIFFNRSACVNG